MFIFFRNCTIKIQKIFLTFSSSQNYLGHNLQSYLWEFWSHPFKMDCAVCTFWNECSCGCQWVWWEKEANVVLHHVWSRNVARLLGSPSFLHHASPTLIRSSLPGSSLETSLSAFSDPHQSIPVCVVGVGVPQCVRAYERQTETETCHEIIFSSTTYPIRQPAACQICQYKSSMTHTSLSRRQKITIRAGFTEANEQSSTECEVCNLSSAVMFLNATFMQDDQKMICWMVSPGIYSYHNICDFGRRCGLLTTDVHLSLHQLVINNHWQLDAWMYLYPLTPTMPVMWRTECGMDG